MNELQRQAYLSALGIESYMPRWHLPCAPESVACLLPVIEIDSSVVSTQSPLIDSIISPLIVNEPAKLDSSTAIDMLGSLDVRQKPVAPINAASILQQFEETKAPVVAPFSLSLWRPLSGFLIIDSRNSAAALPTELLLSNLLHVVFGTTKPDLKEEVLRWPMIENRFVSRTIFDACNELQTWLAVENELRPINRLWLLGENAAQYFVNEDVSVVGSRWQSVAVAGLSGQSSMTALLLPSLSELLQKPIDKALLWAALD